MDTLWVRRTHSHADAQPGQKIDHGELIVGVDEAKAVLHRQHHPHKVIETRQVLCIFQPKATPRGKALAHEARKAKPQVR